MDILKDQEAAIQLVMDCVANNRPLTKGLIHELHIGAGFDQGVESCENLGPGPGARPRRGDPDRDT
jgi:hypothetical protein